MNLSSGDEELLVEGISDLLPTNTQVFASTPRATLPFYLVIWLGGALSILLGLAALAREHDLALYGAAGGLGAAVLLVAYMLHRCTVARHAALVRAGELHEGIIVFPTGDIVVRFTGCCFGLGGADLTVEAAYLSSARVVRRCSPLHARPVLFLELHYLLIDARSTYVAIPQTDVQAPVTKIAAFINAQKGAAVGTQMGGGFFPGGV